MNFPLLDMQGAVGAVNKKGSNPSPWNIRLATPYKLHAQIIKRMYIQG